MSDDLAESFDASASPENESGTRASLFQRLGSPELRDTAWNEFRSRYAPLIAGFAARCGASPQDLDDIVQDVLTQFFSVSHDFIYQQERGRFRGYLKTCTIRATIRRLGKNARFRGIPLDEIPDAELAVEPIWNDVWEQQLVATALVILRDECRNNLAFRAFEQYVLLDRDAEIVAAELGISLNSVHQAKSRITRQLRDTVQRIREAKDG